MELYVFIIVVLFGTAIADLNVGVTNDAVNFLNSAIGSKVGSRRLIMSIAAVGVFANIFFAIIGYLINQPEFAKLNIYFAFFNLIPLSELDGNKIFFGSLILWVLLIIITLVGLLANILVI